jgi:hypothetical protein
LLKKTLSSPEASILCIFCKFNEYIYGGGVEVCATWLKPSISQKKQTKNKYHIKLTDKILLPFAVEERPMKIFLFIKLL